MSNLDPIWQNFLLDPRIVQALSVDPDQSLESILSLCHMSMDMWINIIRKSVFRVSDQDR